MSSAIKTMVRSEPLFSSRHPAVQRPIFLVHTTHASVTAPAAGRADETWLKVGQPNVIRPIDRRWR